MKPILALPLSLLLAAGVAGCGKGSGAGSSDAGKNSPAGRTFLSSSLTDKGKPRPLVSGSRIRLAFKGAGLEVHAGCNHFTGDAEFDGDRLVVSNLGGSEMGCSQDLMKQDEWLTGFLTGKPNWRLDGDTLILTRAEARIELTDRRVADPDRPLQGARWVVEGTLDGDTAAAVPGDVDAHLTLSDNGAVRGDTGCNTFSGKVTTTKSAITFSDIVVTNNACSGERGALDKAMRELLRGTVKYQLEADKLTLTGKSGTGLELKTG
ncbi:MAG: META domain-containing protein [Micromonosporaceae bacterium]|nr:META domain-containing protein [Micromonosporaceae bacterium]